MKILIQNILMMVLTIASITGTSFAETTGNQLDPDHEEGFLDGVYNFPDIHSHQSIIPNDTSIYSGSISAYLTEATQTIDVDVGEGNVLDAINWSVDVSSGAYCQAVPDCNGPGSVGTSDTITIELEFMDTTGSVLDTAGPGTFSLAYTDGGWTTYSGIYDDDNHLGDITSLAFTIGGNDFYNNADGIRFNGMSVTYDYSEEIIPILLAEEIVEDIIEQLLDQGVEESVIEEMFVAVLDVEESEEEQEEEEQEQEEQEESTEEESDEEEESTEEESDEEEAEEVEEESTEEGEEKDESKDEGESSESGDSGSSSDGSSVNANSGSSVSAPSNGALELIDMIKNVNDIAMGKLTGEMDLSAYTDITMEDAIELEDQEEWYTEESFYNSQQMPDSNILDGYDKLKITEGKFYGSNNKLY